MYSASRYYQVFISSNGWTIKYSKKNVEIYIKINIKNVPTCFGLNNHHQGAWHLYFAKVIIIKTVSWNTSLKDISVMCTLFSKSIILTKVFFYYRLDIICSHIAEISFNDLFQLIILIEYTNVSVHNTTIYFIYFKLVYSPGDTFRPSLCHPQALKENRLT